MKVGEIFKDIKEYKGIYQVSKKGLVKSLMSTERILKPEIRRGYNSVTLCNNGKRKKYYIHILVAKTFLDYCTDNPFNLIVDHINNIRTDNRVDNLQLISGRENNSKDQNKHNRTSKYIGVSFSDGKWRALINVDKINYHLGIFKSEKEASIEYKRALKHLERSIDGLDSYDFENNRRKGKEFMKEMSEYYSSNNWL